METEGRPISVLFVCLGNICRSPMAEAIFKHNVIKHDMHHLFKVIDSAGTGAYHVGSPPDSRSARICQKYGVPVNHLARQVTAQDFQDFDFVLAMDNSNLEDLQDFLEGLNKGEQTIPGKVQLFGDYREPGSKVDRIVRDPYYGGINGFENNFKQLTSFSEEFLRRLLGTKL